MSFLIKEYRIEEWNEHGNTSCETAWLCALCARQLQKEGYVVMLHCCSLSKENCQGREFGLPCDLSNKIAA